MALLQVQHLSKRYEKDKRVLSDINMEVEKRGVCLHYRSIRCRQVNLSPLHQSDD